MYTILNIVPLLSSFPLQTIIKPIFIAALAIGFTSVIKGLFINPQQGGRSFIRIITGVVAYGGIIVAFNIASSSGVLNTNENAIQDGSDRLVQLLYLVNMCLVLFGCVQLATAITINRSPFIGIVSFIGGLFMYGAFRVIF